MAEINTTLNISFEDGKLIALNERIKETNPVASQPSAIDEVTMKSGNGFYTGYVTKKIKRAQSDSTAATKVGGVGGFVGASSQQLHKVFIGKTYREDNIVYNEQDLIKLKEGKGGDIVALETGDFLITGRELDLKSLLADLKTKAAAAKLHSAFDANGAPTGTQTAQTAYKEADALAAIKAGLRVVGISDLDEAVGTRLHLLRAGIQYLNSMGTAKNSAEEKYLFSINGHALNTIKVLAAYEDAVAIKDGVTTNFINVTPDTMRNITGMVGYIDNSVKVILTNQLDAETHYVILTNRVFRRDLDESAQYIAKVRDAASVVMKDGTSVNLKPNERLVQFYQGRAQGVVYFEEAFFITKHA